VNDTEERNIVENIRRSRQPKTAAERLECHLLRDAIEQLDLTSAAFVRAPSDMGSLVVRLEYSGGPLPKTFWARWLVIRIWPLIGFSWAARIRGYSNRVLLTVPRPDKIDESFAWIAQQSSSEPKIYRVLFGIMFPERFYKRDFILIQ
jgi:hypothetical protein